MIRFPFISRLRAGALCAALCGWNASGLAADAAGPSPVRSLLEMRQQDVVIQQWDNSCGAAALATVLRHHLRDEVSERQVAQGMLRTTDPLKVRHRGGFSLLDMKRLAVSRGHEADGYVELGLDQLRSLAPAIVPLHLDGYDHFVVFQGTVGDRVLLADPGFGNREIPISRFVDSWSRVAFVVRRANR